MLQSKIYEIHVAITCSDIICNTSELILMCLADMLINPSLHTKIPACK